MEVGNGKLNVSQHSSVTQRLGIEVGVHKMKCERCKLTLEAGSKACSKCGQETSAIRRQVFEVIVRQAIAGAPWREICAGPMLEINITAEEVEAEVERRRASGIVVSSHKPSRVLTAVVLLIAVSILLVYAFGRLNQ